MKILIGIVFASLMFANIGFAEMKLIEYKVLGPNSDDRYYSLTTICIDGYKFVMAGLKNTESSIIQFYEHSGVPARC